MLRSYKNIHALIDPFEKALRENTPCESISDPKSLIDYINSFSLRADMVKEEMIRVAKERDEQRDQAAKAKAELEELKKAAPMKKLAASKGGDDLFNFDDEQGDLGAKVEGLEKEIQSLKMELEASEQGKKVAQEAVESMQQSVEDSQAELEGIKDTSAAKDEVIKDVRAAAEKAEKELAELKLKLEDVATDAEIMKVEAQNATEKANTLLGESKSKDTELEKVKKECSEKTEALEDKTKELDEKTQELAVTTKELASTRGKPVEDAGAVKELRKALEGKDQVLSKYEKDAKSVQEETEKLKSVNNDLQRTVAVLEGRLQLTQKTTTAAAAAETPRTVPANKTEPPKPAPTGANAAKNKKKRNKKKGKSGTAGTGATGAAEVEESQDGDAEAVVEEETHTEATGPVYTSETIIADLQSQLDGVRKELVEKEERIERLAKKAVDTEALKEEIESLRDDLVNIGQDHTDARDKLKTQSKDLVDITTRRDELEAKVQALEAELAVLKDNQSSTSADTEKLYEGLKVEFEGLKQTSAALQTDLQAAQQLASTRFKDLSELRGVLEKQAPELASLRTENSALVATKAELSNKAATIGRLERKERELKNDLSTLGNKMSAKENEVTSLKAKFSTETSERKKSDELLRAAQKDLRQAEAEKKELSETLVRTRQDLKRAQDNVTTLNKAKADIESNLKNLTNERDDMKEELELKTAQVASSTSLMNSMRDQTSELIVQTKEAKEQYESAQEELLEANRLLGERTRETETMRHLLSDVETRHEGRTRAMKERMEAAIEERDKAEEEAATIGRRRAREIEEMKDKVREAEKNLRRAEEAQLSIETDVAGLREGKRRAEEILERERQELEDTKRAMSSMTATLDDTDGQVRDIERQKAELRLRAEQAEAKHDRLQKQHRVSL